MKKLVTILLGILCIFSFPFCTTVKAEESKQPVSVVEIDYEEFSMRLNPNGNMKIYYSTSEEKNAQWYQVEGVKDSTGCFILDISWVSDKKDVTLYLKGSENETVVAVTLPAANNALVVKYDKGEEILIFENEEGAKTFEWRKSTSYEWQPQVSVRQVSTNATVLAFRQAMEQLKVKGGKIYVRLPQEKGTSAKNPGSRPSKQVLVSIPKRSNAPSLKVNINTLALTTTTSMEYRIYSIGGTVYNRNWTNAEKNMKLSELAPETLYTSSNRNPREVIIAYRKAATDSSSYSKTGYLTIPPQIAAPEDIIVSSGATKYELMFPEASTERVYQYAVVKSGNKVDESKLSWRNVGASKKVTLRKSSYPEGSKIYVRLKGTAANTKVDLVLPSAWNIYTTQYQSK